MVEISQVEVLIFDFDGTLHDGTKLSLSIFKNCLADINKQYPLFESLPTDEEILSQFGKQAEDIYPDILQTTDPVVIKTFSSCVEQSEIQALNSGKGTLYPSVMETLGALKKHTTLAMYTNARVDYFEAAIKRFQLAPLFEIMYAAGYYPGKNKIWMVQEIIQKLNVKHFAVVGDRIHDIEAAKVNGGLAIGCTYGFGKEEVKSADIQISNFRDLLSLFSENS